jgi:serine/threonine protein kinase
VSIEDLLIEPAIPWNPASPSFDEGPTFGARARKLRPYGIVGPLGGGGMGEVFRGKDTRLGRDVAVEVLAQHLSSNAEICARFEQEPRTAPSSSRPGAG